MMEEEFDFWSDRLGIKYGGYSSEVDQDILNVAKLIVKARADDTFIFGTEIAEQLNLSLIHVELIQYILAGIDYPARDGQLHYTTEPFEYGTSPRGLFVGDEMNADKFIAEFEQHLKTI